MFKNHPIDTVRVEHVTAHTVVLDVQTAAPLHLVWPNVRGNYADVPYGLRAVSAVCQKKMGTEDFGDGRAGRRCDMAMGQGIRQRRQVQRRVGLRVERGRAR